MYINANPIITDPNVHVSSQFSSFGGNTSNSGSSLAPQFSQNFSYCFNGSRSSPMPRSSSGGSYTSNGNHFNSGGNNSSGSNEGRSFGSNNYRPRRNEGHKPRFNGQWSNNSW